MWCGCNELLALHNLRIRHARLHARLTRLHYVDGLAAHILDVADVLDVLNNALSKVQALRTILATAPTSEAGGEQ